MLALNNFPMSSYALMNDRDTIDNTREEPPPPHFHSNLPSFNPMWVIPKLVLKLILTWKSYSPVVSIILSMNSVDVNLILNVLAQTDQND